MWFFTFPRLPPAIYHVDFGDSTSDARDPHRTPVTCMHGTRAGLSHEKSTPSVVFLSTTLETSRIPIPCLQDAFHSQNKPLKYDNRFLSFFSVLGMQLPQATLHIVCVVASQTIIHLGLLKVGEDVLAGPSIDSPRIVVGLLSAVVKHHVGAARPAKDLTSKTTTKRCQARASGQQMSNVVWNTFNYGSRGRSSAIARYRLWLDRITVLNYLACLVGSYAMATLARSCSIICTKSYLGKTTGKHGNTLPFRGRGRHRPR